MYVFSDDNLALDNKLICPSLKKTISIHLILQPKTNSKVSNMLERHKSYCLFSSFDYVLRSTDDMKRKRICRRMEVWFGDWLWEVLLYMCCFYWLMNKEAALACDRAE